ncbi:RNA polymerase sigma factor [Flavitalea sp.]|nr:RNA polymerase sigma factor [Flavitalea sp.]
MEKEFINLINDHRALIFKVCNVYCHETETRRDLFQEVVLQLWRSFPGFKRESSNSTWIYKVALNTAISNFRKETKRVGKSSITALEFEIPDMSFDPDSLDNNHSLQQAIDKLNDLEKAVVMLYLDENSYEEMSEILGLSISNIGVRINRIKKKLTKILKTY